jgi:Fe-S cluster biogenesis protein NfuA/nitrite reductase/ring-hydroxylating ferredoxin subunit
VHDDEARDRVGRVEALLERVETLPDPAARDIATEVVGALLDLYGEGLARMVDHVAEGDDGRLAEALASDELVSHLLLLHGLHPVPLEARVRGALDEVRPYLESHGGNVDLLGVEDGVARLRMEGSCSGCPSSTVTLKLAIEEAIHKAAPDIDRIEAEGVDAAVPAPAGGGLLQIEMALPMAAAAPANGTGNGNGNEAWAMAGGMPELRGGGHVVKLVSGEPVLFASLEETVYAYRPDCPACARSLAEGALVATELACPGCGHRYEVRLAGRCLDDPDLHLEPVPLLVDDAGLVKVALGSPA